MADDEHVQGALTALGEAEAVAGRIGKALRRRAVRDQLALTVRPDVEGAEPETFLGYLWLPAWTWMMLAAFAVAISVPIPSVWVGVAMLAAAVGALVLRTALTVRAAPMLFRPEEQEIKALQAALTDAGRHMRSIGAHDPYRAEPPEWVGRDPTDAVRPWTELAAIRGTAAALRRRALPPGKG